MTHSPALTSARDALTRARPYVDEAAHRGYDGTQGAAIRKEALERRDGIDEALAAIESDLAASADAGKLAEEAKRLVRAACIASFKQSDTNLPDYIAERKKHQSAAEAAIDQLAALSRPAPATGKEPLQVAPVSAQGDERAAFESWLGREAFTERCDSGKYASAHIDATWSAWQARAQVAQGDEVDAARWRFIREGSKDFWIADGRNAFCPDDWDSLSGEEADQAIDAARAQQGGQR